MDNNKFNKFFLDETEYETTLPRKYLMRKGYQKKDDKKISAFIPGLIVSVFTEKGKKVKKGDRLLILEAMKMKNDLMSPLDGTVKELLVKEGSIVTKGQLLLEIE
jgi:biotin carboxyl carrier protein